MFFCASLAVYLQLGIMDAAFGVRIGRRQYNLHASRWLGAERTDTRVGPIRVVVIEPLQTLRVVVEDNEHGIACDLVFDGRFAPVEEPRTTRWLGTRLFMDATRLTQLGDWRGHTRVVGHDLTLDSGTMVGTRDRSWGIRGVGARDPQAPPVVPQFHWFWVPGVLEDRVFHYFINQDEHGEVWNRGMTVTRQGGTVEHLAGATIAATLVPGTRWPARATVKAPDGKGGTYRVDLEAGRRFYMSAVGYMSPAWSHGLNKGPLATGYDEIATDQVVRHEPPWLHVQAFANITMTTPDGQVLRGVGTL